VGGSYLPYLTAAADEPEAVAYLAGESGRAGRWLAIANEQVRAIDPDFPGPLIGPYDEFREHLVKAQDDLVFGGASPQDALARAQAAIDAALPRYSDEGF
jgi:sn-glycerol 3-phosphate transport system substrate-binding protein